MNGYEIAPPAIFGPKWGPMGDLFDPSGVPFWVLRQELDRGNRYLQKSNSLTDGFFVWYHVMGVTKEIRLCLVWQLLLFAYFADWRTFSEFSPAPNGDTITENILNDGHTTVCQKDDK